jgi:UDP-galactopyranose mutase
MDDTSREFEVFENMIHIVGAGLVGLTLANLLPGDITVYEREDEIGGACIDNANYQKFVHIMHTDYEDVWEFVNRYTDVRPHSTVLKSYVRGELHPWLPQELTEQVWENQVRGYSKKQWLSDPPKEALARIKTDPDGKIFHDKYEGVVNYTKLFSNLADGKTILKLDARHGDFPESDKVVLTGAVDEYFGYCYGELPYRGMKSVHYQSEIRLEADYYTFSDEKIPFQRIIDYDRLGYEGGWIGIEIACNDKHYPVRNDESEVMYNKYVQLAKSHGVDLVGRLATYRYIDSDDAIRQAIDYAAQY